MKKQKSMMDHMRSRNAMVGGEDPIKSKKLETEPIKKLSYLREDEDDPVIKSYYDRSDKKLKSDYELGIMQREINNLRRREAMLGGPKKVTKKIMRREKVKNAVTNAINFLGTN
jgi:hypothetical protein